MHSFICRFRMPAPNQTTAPGAVQSERDAWVHAIDKLCSDWKRKSRGEHTFVETQALRNISIAEDAESADTDLESNGGFGGGNTSHVCPPVDNESADPTSGGGDRLSAGDTGQSYPSADKPVAKPRSSMKIAVQVIGPDVSPPVPSPTSPGVVAPSSPTSPQPSPAHTASTSSKSVPESLPHESGLSVVKVPSPPRIPAPPPLPFKLKTNSRKPSTKAFHWDVVGPEKVTLSLKVKTSFVRIISQLSMKLTRVSLVQIIHI